MSPQVRPLLAVAVTSCVVAAAALVGPATATAAPTTAAPSCSAFDDPIYQRVKASNDASLLTPWQTEAKGAARYGFTEDDGVAFHASRSSKPGLVPVHRLFKKSGQDFLVTANQGEWASAVTKHQYQDQGVSFYASAVPADCLAPVYRYVKKSKHRLAAATSVRNELTAAGWQLEGVAFYAAPGADEVDEPPSQPAPQPEPSGDTKFSFAVYPDTQQEVGRDSRFINRTNWLLKNRSSLDLRFVAHTGDIVNWDTPTHDQYEVASKAMKPLEDAKIPYSIAIGNHDTQATGVGGAARDPRNTRKLQRDTSTFNKYFTASRYGGVSGTFEKGKVDNVYSLYEAGGVKWMVLTLELWPRQSVVDWAKTQVAAHPDYNVVVATHNYLNGDGSIAGSAEYGDTSPKSLYNQLISQYPNIRMVLSGHVGFAASRVDTGKNGNKIYSFLTTIHSGTTNPTRMFEVDTKAGTLKTWIYAPYNNQTWTSYNQTVRGIDWVR